MSEPIRPTQIQIATLKQNKDMMLERLKDIDSLLAAGAPPDEIDTIKKQYQETIAQINKILAVYD